MLNFLPTCIITSLLLLLPFYSYIYSHTVSAILIPTLILATAFFTLPTFIFTNTAAISTLPTPTPTPAISTVLILLFMKR